MDDGADDEEVGIKGAGAIAHHLPKRVRRDKSAVIVYDEADRRNFVTGFHKRKKKRRKIADMQKKFRERQKRLQERRERRLQRSIALGEAVEEGHNGCGTKEEGEGEEEIHGMDKHPIQDIVSYEDADTKTIVTMCPILPGDDAGNGFINNRSTNINSYGKEKLFWSAEEKTFRKFDHTQQTERSFPKARAKQGQKNRIFPKARGKQGQPKSFVSKKRKK